MAAPLVPSKPLPGSSCSPSPTHDSQVHQICGYPGSDLRLVEFSFGFSQLSIHQPALWPSLTPSDFITAAPRPSKKP
jgi:hypothetical protein